jgi:hypothetical protein
MYVFYVIFILRMKVVEARNGTFLSICTVRYGPFPPRSMAIRAGVNAGLAIDSGTVLVLVGVDWSRAFCVFWLAVYRLIITLPLLPHDSVDSQFFTSTACSPRNMKFDVKVVQVVAVGGSQLPHPSGQGGLGALQLQA